jgi:hypothetical protein
MSSARYIEFDSTYRDRVLYPLASDFIVEMAQSGQGTKLTARDPVSDASPVLIWNNSFIEGTTGSNYIAGLRVSTGPNLGNQGAAIFQITATTGSQQLKQVRNFYVGSVLARDSVGAYPPTAPITARRIIDYQSLYYSTGPTGSSAMVTLDSALPDSLVGLSGFYIANPTPIPTNTPNATVKFYIPGSNSCIDPVERTQNYGLGSDNYYVNFNVMNTDTGTTRKITSFDAVTRLATLDSPTPATEADWASNNITGAVMANFVIRKDNPVEGRFGVGNSIVYATARAVQLQQNVGAPSPPTDTYNGDFLRINPYPNAPTPYNVTTAPPYNGGVATSYPANCQTEERRIQRYVYGLGTITAVNGYVVTLDSNASSGSEYVGAFISNTNVPPQPLPNYYFPTATIIAYNGVTKQATLSNNTTFTVSGGSWLIRTCILSSPFSVAPNPQSLYEIELFSRDNYNPFVYTGSLVSSQESVCYEVELLNLILPNAILASGRGGRPIFYPYLYVMLQPVSSDAGTNKNIIYSNNPNSYGMLYRAVVDDTPIPAVSPFIKIDGDGMVHVIKFKPNTAFRFAVFHANGEPFRTVLDEQYSPSIPNALTQISACFAFKRV